MILGFIQSKVSQVRMHIESKLLTCTLMACTCSGKTPVTLYPSALGNLVKGQLKDREAHNDVAPAWRKCSQDSLLAGS